MHQPQILIVGSGARASLESIYKRALQRVGVPQVDLFDTSIYYRSFLPHRTLPARVINIGMTPLMAMRAEKGLLQYLRAKSSDYDAIIIFKGADFSRKCLEAGREIQPKSLWININPDDPLNVGNRGSTNSKVSESLSFFDLYCIWSRNLIPKLIEQGCRRVEYLPFGYDLDLHVAPQGNVDIKPHTVVFVGAWDRPREATLTTISDYSLHIYGNQWDRIPAQSPLRRRVVQSSNIYEREAGRVLSENAVSLNLLRSQNYGAHNMRTFEIPAMGGLMLTTRSVEQETFFPEGEASLMFEDVNEMKLKMDWAFSNPQQALKIRERAVELVKKHSYTERARQLLEMMRNA